MRKLIDKDDLMEILLKMQEIYFDRKVILGKVIDQVKDMPTVESEIIHCADCKFWVGGYIVKDDDFMPPHCWKRDGVWTHDDYCSYAVRAERRTDA